MHSAHIAWVLKCSGLHGVVVVWQWQAEQLEVGLPSAEDAAQLLLKSAGITLDTLPPAVFGVVEICGRLPLALDIAGKLLADMGLCDGESTDWRGIPDMLRTEMKRANAETPDEETLEYMVIGASLNKLRAQDRAAVKVVFSVFAVVAEDTHVPPSAFRIMYNALSGGAEGDEAASELQLRRIMQLLINRSLVLVREHYRHFCRCF